MRIPTLCQACYKHHHSTVVKACPFCRDVQVPEAILCDLVRDNDGDEQAFHCEAFRPTLSVVPHDHTEALHTEESGADTMSMSPKDKWFRAYAVQQLSLNPDLISCTLRYHVVFSTRQRVPCFSSQHDEPMADLVRQASVYRCLSRLFPRRNRGCHHGVRGTRDGQSASRLEAYRPTTMGTSVFFRRHRVNWACSRS